MSDKNQRLHPLFDVLESDEHFLLRADVPGLVADGVDIQLEKGLLTFIGTRARGDETFEYRRQFQIPEVIDPEGVVARLDAGVLEVELAKRDVVKPRRIMVQTA